MFTNEQLSNAMQTAADNFDSGEWQWAKGDYGYDGGEELDNASYCMIGACAKALKSEVCQIEDDVAVPLLSCMTRLFPQRTGNYAFKFNDHLDTNLADVVAVLRCSAKEILA